MTEGEELESFQAIVISLKDTFFNKADGLVGIYHDHEEDCSKTLTLQLKGEAKEEA